MNTSEKTSGLTSKQTRIKFGQSKKPQKCTHVLAYAMKHPFGGNGEFFTAYVLMLINVVSGMRVSANLYNSGKKDGIGARFGAGFSAEGSLVTPLPPADQIAGLGQGNKKKPYKRLTTAEVLKLCEGCVEIIPVPEPKQKPSKAPKAEAKATEPAPAS